MESNGIIHLTLIRHGITSYNVEKRYLGHTDIPVINERMQECETVCEPDMVYSSDLKRCKQTAYYLFREQNTIYDERLREMNFGDYEGKTYEQLKDETHYRQWLDDWEQTAPLNGESGEQFKQRIQQFIKEEILQDNHCGQTLAIVSHGGVIRYIVSSLCNIPYWDIDVQHGKTIDVSVQKIGGKWTCTLL